MSRKVRQGRKGCETGARSVFENSVLGSTGHWPVPSGDSPDGTGATVRANGHGLFATLLAEVRRVADRGGRVARATHFQNRLSEKLLTKWSVKDLSLNCPVLPFAL